MNINVYVPDELGKRIKNERLEVSQIFQRTVERVLEERELARATGGKMKRIEVEVGTPKGGLYTKAFKGKWLVEPRAMSTVVGPRLYGVALSEKGKFLVYAGNSSMELKSGKKPGELKGVEKEGGAAGGELYVFDSLAEAQETVLGRGTREMTPALLPMWFALDHELLS